MNPFGIVIHGGAGTVSRSKITKWKAEAYRQALKNAYNVGFTVLKKGGTAIEAVRQAIIILEDCPLFNAGKGSVYTHDEKIEMDAAIMDGRKRMAGAVAGVTSVRNPIVLAESVMRKSRHVLISGEQALAFAREQGLPFEDQSYFEDEFRYKQLLKAKAKDKVTLDHDAGEDQKYGTVGAVALDKKGNLAAGTSTGGMVNKKYGRIGDSPLIGIGTYADNLSCAISCTGHGEYFIRAVVAHDIASRIRYKGESLKEAAHQVIMIELPHLGGRGGLIGIDRQGEIVLPFNTKGMYRGFRHSNGQEYVGIYGD
jgi:beta-aspartyl-peptidase (threonine type)